VPRINGLGTQRFDPLGLATDLPLSATYYPAGFRLNLTTNSRDVLGAAEEAWGHYGQEFASEPLRFRVVVQPEGELSQEPVHRAQDHLYSAVSDQHNFAICDLTTLSASIFVSAKTAADHAWLRWFYIESIAYLLLCQRYLVAVHAGCIALDGTGVLLAGPSGAGKSTLTFACARAGWTYLTDDCTWLLPDSEARIAIGRPAGARFRLDAPELFPELAGYIARARPNGKISIEVPTSAFPEIRTASRAPIGALVFLERMPHASARAISMSGGEAMDRMLGDLPSYGPEVNAMHERTVRRLAEVPAYRMRYEALDEAVALLKKVLFQGLS
jgi:hypothetical protein